MRLVVAAVLVCLSSPCLAQESQPPDPCEFQPELTLTVHRTFQADATITLCSHWNSSSKFLRISVMPEEAGAKTVERQIEIDDPTYLQMTQLHGQALRYNVMDDAAGPDGSRWCLETDRGFTYLKACFWTPSADTAKRGLEGLRSLGEFLWDIAGLEPQIGKLY